MVYSAFKANRSGSPLPPRDDEMEYHMENNPLYMAVKSTVGHSTMKLQHEYEIVDITRTV